MEVKIILKYYVGAIIAFLIWFVPAFWTGHVLDKLGNIHIEKLILHCIILVGLFIGATLGCSLELTRIKKVSEEVSDNKSVQVSILRNKKEVNVYDFMVKLLKVNSRHKKGYVLLNNVNLFFPKNKEIIANSDVIAFDLLEMAFWTWLSKRYHLHWDVDIDEIEGISGGGGTIDIKSDAEKEPLKLSLEDIQKYLKNNTYSAHKGNIWGITLPSGSSLDIQRNGAYSRIINIKNQYIDFKIKMYHPGNSGLEFTVFGENIKKSLQSPEEWFVEDFKVKFDCKYTIPDNETLQFEKQKKWVNEIMENFYNDFEWALIEPDLDKAYSMSKDAE